ncbi:hypothetical protein LTR64_008268 [Lithohypha guttulata]|uniref:uncharacterized protein n=1 Tax=Lithohypha guttulata TaxID=1690604 RepID=UPI002DE05D3A|nr:hypothetical protein LTR51_008420 [Lithohypha guttulata]
MSTSTPDRARGRSGSLHSSARKSKAGPAPMNINKRHQDNRSLDTANSLAVGDRTYDTSRPRANSISNSTAQSYGRTPNRSFYHRSFHGQLDPAQYSSEGLREQTAEIASLAYSDNTEHSPTRSEDGQEYPPVIEEVSEPVTPAESAHERSGEALLALIPDLPSPVIEARRRTPPFEHSSLDMYEGQEHDVDERTALLKDNKSPTAFDGANETERQKPDNKSTLHLWYGAASANIKSGCYTLSHPKTWSGRAVLGSVVVRPAKLLPAVFLGLLLNILDALSYGMILFPLGHQLFDDLGSDGIAIFYVSTIIAQLVYSCGGSVFRGGIGSEMIEVVPFFHKMAFLILEKVGEDDSKSVLATTVLSFAISSVLTGAVFFLMGACRLGSLIGFFPRHILIGCIGGVGWFLVATGVEVSARLPGNLEYNIPTLKQLFRADTFMLWLIPLALAIVLMITQRFVKSNFLVGGYFVSVAAIFYFFKFALGIQMDTLHSNGWIFDSPPAGNPWYHFWTLYDLKAVHWGALADTIPTMFALTFFGILHVPINVPALGISTGEDNLNVDRELIAHGVSNTLSGLCGSVQNYLVYTNSLLFIDCGGNDRLAGILLAAGTFGILLAGPVIIGYIPIMVVGALIFLLGIELLEEAVVDTFGKVHKLEYATIWIIVITMGIWDFVAGILVGIVLAALNFVVQTSQRTAIRAEYSGEIAQSTVRRPPVQRKFLHEAGQQLFVIKLAGFLFFGTIVGVENRIRALLADDAFRASPLRFVVLDMSSINGIDFSAAEAFTRINRLLSKRGVQLLISGLELDGEIGMALRNVGLFSEDSGVSVYETLNQSLQDCENKLLKALYEQQKQRAVRSSRTTSHLDIPASRTNVDFSASYRQEFLVSSPRQNQLHEAATATLEEDHSSLQKWSAYKAPLPLLMQIFGDVSDKNEDFWHKAVPYFEKVTYPRNSVLFNAGDKPSGFYLLEEGLLRADYDLPQGRFSELIVEKRPCGELPFFSDTPRTARLIAETHCVIWQLTDRKWHELQKAHPDIAQELLKISLKLTKERMDTITAYVMTAAG